MTHLIAALILAASPVEVVTVAEVDCIEIESVYDANGAHLLDQILARNWQDDTGHFEVDAWCLVKNRGNYPRQEGDWTVVRWPGPIGREVRSKMYVRSWHQFDSEVLERSRWPQERRRELFGEPQPTPAPAITPEMQETARRWFGGDPLPPEGP